MANCTNSGIITANVDYPSSTYFQRPNYNEASGEITSYTPLPEYSAGPPPYFAAAGGVYGQTSGTVADRNATGGGGTIVANMYKGLDNFSMDTHRDILNMIYFYARATTSLYLVHLAGQLIGIVGTPSSYMAEFPPPSYGTYVKLYIQGYYEWYHFVGDPPTNEAIDDALSQAANLATQAGF